MGLRGCSLLEPRPLVSLEDENPVHWHVLRKDSPAVHRHAKDTRNTCGGPYATTSEAYIESEVGRVVVLLCLGPGRPQPFPGLLHASSCPTTLQSFGGSACVPGPWAPHSPLANVQGGHKQAVSSERSASGVGSASRFRVPQSPILPRCRTKSF